MEAETSSIQDNERVFLRTPPGHGSNLDSASARVNEPAVFRQMCDHSSDALFLVDPDRRLRYVNASACRQTGYLEAELLGRKMAEVAPEMNPERIRTVITEIKSRGWIAPFESVARCKDGSGVPVEIAASLIVLEGRDHLLAAVRDITAHKQTEDGLYADKLRLEEDTSHLERSVAVRSQMLRLLHDVTAHCHRAGSLEEALEFVVPEFCRFDGWSFGQAYRPEPARPGEMKPVAACFEDRPGRFRKYREAIRRLRWKPGQGLPGSVWSRGRPEYVPVFRSGIALWRRCGLAGELGMRTAAGFPIQLKGEVLAVIECFSARQQHSNKRILKIIGTIGGQLALVEQRKRSEEALRRSEARLRRLVDSNIAAVFISDFAGTIREANPAILQLLGSDREEMLAGRLNWRERTAPESEPARHDILDALRIRGTSEPRELRLLRNDGSRVPVLAGMALLEDSHDPHQIISFVVDLSEIQRLERRLLEISDYEKQKLGQDLHDGLSQQITGIKFQMDSLARSLRDLSATHAERAGGLVTLLTHAEQATHDLAHSLLPLRKGTSGLAEALEDLTVLMNQLYQRPCDFQMRKSVSVPDSQTAMHLYRIAQEAVGNAMKHGQPNRVTVSFGQRRRHVLLEIRDDGRGMSPETGTCPNKKSLGLDIMRYRAGLIGARLAIDSKPGAGTTVLCEWLQPATGTNGSPRPRSHRAQTRNHS